MPEPTFEWVDIDRMAPNPWNPNAMDPEMYGKAIESIHEFGFVDPVTVRTEIREKAGGWGAGIYYQIIDGEHRWKAAQEHGNCVRAKKGGGWERHGGLKTLPVTNLGVVTDEVAQQLTIVLNETRGTFDPKKMGALLTDLVTVKPLAALAAVLPFSADRIGELAELPKVDWNNPRFNAKPSSSGTVERWVERVYRLPPDAAEALDKAIQLCREDDRATDAQAIQTIAESFLESR